MAGNAKWAQFSEEQKDALLDSLEGLYNEDERIQEAVEKKFGYTDPSLATKRALRKENDELKTRLDDFEAKQREKEIKATIQSEKDRAQEKYKLSDDDMKEVSKLMIESGIGSYDKAADYFRLSRQAAKPTSANVQEHSSIMLPGDVELFKDRNGWARKEAYKALAEIERNRP